MKICLADLSQEALDGAAEQLSAASVLMVPTDVSKMEEVQRLKERVYADFGEVAVLMNNAGTSPGGGPWDHYERWERVLSVNLWGVINGVHAFTQAIINQGVPAVRCCAREAEHWQVIPKDQEKALATACFSFYRVLPSLIRHRTLGAPICQLAPGEARAAALIGRSYGAVQ